MSEKEKRIKKRREYFIRAAKEIIDYYGVKALSVRKVAEQAGYAPATIYNYFGSMDGLLSAVMDSYAAEAMEWLREKSSLDLPAARKIKVLYIEFARFFLEKPDLFKIIFMNENLVVIDDADIIPNFKEMYRLRIELFQRLSLEHGYESETAVKLERIITSMLFGMLYSYYYSTSNNTKEELLDELRLNIEYLIPEARDSE
ncbi:TetR/AcrR family transcriptional regulator [Kosmotoga pacifica]|uniref:HTH tetR-type domain-containing protein n=1 Tax=Kosmotoga pacifica TaxID=1330330 RepID=A0A0G2Z7W2_9BACT|nr:TetR/AcrR family transcriptional regulator [Kosmotoga pacifica]AKI97690.1 hypothetical protein IX53_07540 [Kosmotoga pacifica]